VLDLSRGVLGDDAAKALGITLLKAAGAEVAGKLDW